MTRTVVVVLAAAAVGCDSDPSEVAEGGECFVATDCAPGLVCVPTPKGTRACSRDLERYRGQPPDGLNLDAGPD